MESSKSPRYIWEESGSFLETFFLCLLELALEPYHPTAPPFEEGEILLLIVTYVLFSPASSRDPSPLPLKVDPKKVIRELLFSPPSQMGNMSGTGPAPTKPIPI